MPSKPPIERHVRNAIRAAVLGAAFLLSFYLMFHTFSYDRENHRLMIASKAWSDFGAHIPMIRSFSYGANLTRLIHGQPVESPLYPGEPIRYHFGFYAIVGAFERIGLPLDWAFNLPSALGFFFLMIFIYLVSYELFANVFLSVLSVVFFLFNGSLSFLRFFAVHPLNINSLFDITTNSRFPAFGPWDGGDITAFWNLNIYTNQRHLALSYAIILAVLWILLRRSKKQKPWLSAIGIALLSSLLLFCNFPAASIFFVFALSLFIFKKETRLPLIIAAIVTSPALLYLTHVANIHSDIVWQPGYLASPATAKSIFTFWVDNVGLNVLLIPLGLALSPKHIRRIFLLPLAVIFVLPNLYRFSPDMINNHKFFNFFVIIGNMFSAYAIVRITNCISKALGGYDIFADRFPSPDTKKTSDSTVRHQDMDTDSLTGSGAKKFRTDRRAITVIVSTLCAGIIVCTLTLSGFIDLFPIINDAKGSIQDAPVNPDVVFFRTQTKPTDVILNSTWFYHPATLAGRSIFSGYTYFTWSYGYNQTAREQIQRDIYSADTVRDACMFLTQNNISYVELNPHTETFLQPNVRLWSSVLPVYENPDTHLKVFSVREMCKNIRP